jgi:predicted AlkP superfamily phosphohydrolase/phosphomutase
MERAGISVTTPITAYAQAGGGYAFVYINTIGRTDGVISPIGTAGYTATQDAIVTALTHFTDTDRLTGATVYPFESVVRKQDLAAQGLNIETAGDVYAGVLPGYSLNGATTAGPITSPVAFGGTHGYNPAQPAMYGVFLAAGPHISRIEPRPTRQIDVAPTIVDVLGVAPLSNADGRSLNLRRWLNYLPVFIVLQ